MLSCLKQKQFYTGLVLLLCTEKKMRKMIEQDELVFCAINKKNSHWIVNGLDKNHKPIAILREVRYANVREFHKVETAISATVRCGFNKAVVVFDEKIADDKQCYIDERQMNLI